MAEDKDSFRVNFSEESLKWIEERFKAQDADGNGYIDKYELGDCLRCVGFVLTESDLEELIKHFDRNGDGKLVIREIIDNLHIVNARSLQKDDLMQAFHMFDINKDGFIRLPELVKILTTDQGMPVPEARKLVDRCVREFDKNHDGKFDYGEFVEMCLSGTFSYQGQALTNEETKEGDT